jgi:hypothetical protein
MRRTLLCLAALVLCQAAAARPEPEPGANTPPEGFKALFNGKDLTGWQRPGGNKDNWKAEKGVLFVNKSGGGWLFTDKQYGDFELRLEFKVPKGGNSGVGLRSPLKGDPAYVGMEIQILDDPSYKGLQKWQHTGSIYGVVPSSKQPTNPVGQWNKYRIVCKGRHVSVELNGEKIVDANLDDYKKEHARKHPGILRDRGHIGLQEHGGRVEFRNVFIKELK